MICALDLDEPGPGFHSRHRGVELLYAAHGVIATGDEEHVCFCWEVEKDLLTGITLLGADHRVADEY